MDLYTQEELNPPLSGCSAGGDHKWVPEGNATYWVCYKGNEHTDMHLLDDDGLCLNCFDFHIRHFDPHARETNGSTSQRD